MFTNRHEGYAELMLSNFDNVGTIYGRQLRVAEWLVGDSDDDEPAPLPPPKLECIDRGPKSPPPPPPPKLECIDRGPKSPPPPPKSRRSEPTINRKRCRIESGSEGDTSPRSASIESDTCSEDGLPADTSWKDHETWFSRNDKNGWPEKRGIINNMKRFTNGRTPCEGRRLRMCIESFEHVCRGQKHRVEHKVGLAFDARVRWEHYIKDGEVWKPDFMVLLQRPPSREGAGYMEAGLIQHIWADGYYKSNSINVKRGDLGGEGPRRADRAHHPHYVSVCIRLVQRYDRV
jgi:hypothetical protein